MRQGDRYVLYTGSEERFTEKHRVRLHDNGIKEVFILSEERECFHDYVEENLGKILSDRAIPLPERSKVLYDASSSIVEDIFNEKLPVQVQSKQFERISGLVRDSLDFLSNDGAFKALAPFISHDYRTYTHCIHVFTYATAILQTYDVDKELLFRTGLGAMLHDLGKTRIPHAILSKPGPLTEEERVLMNAHSLHGVAMCTSMPLEQESINVILFHHEKMDGTGYPSGIPGEAIPMNVRVVTVCDIYDALTSDRPYAKARLPYDALRLMKNRMSGTFDTDVFKRLVTLLSGSNIL